MSRIASAIDRGDHTFLKTLPGVGQQKARDIVAKLQGKVARFLLIQEPEVAAALPIPDFGAEALAVLLQLEYTRAQAETMIRTTLEGAPAIADAESLLAEIYRGKAKKNADE
jgi:Holliday junction DNA helicase RuvA